jgi:hypothetical protein
MATFAVIADNVVENVIVAENKEIADLVTGKVCVEYTDENPAHVGLKYQEGVFEQPPIPEIYNLLE